MCIERNVLISVLQNQHCCLCRIPAVFEAGMHTKFFLLLYLILLFSRTLCDARCYFRPASKYGCLSNRNLYVFGAVWKTEDCYQCRCKMNAMICCSLVLIPKNYDRANCVGLFHKKSCSIRVVKKTNPDISCKVYNGIG
ncbi:beta-microseminoprotein-like [Chroicocephalus ridibundus]|uniref:beta-microseminoprotein-like n=1 Tax=Chroicocephalus ridibundus TaxID=1192867 RepID=UPI002FDE68A8